MLSFLNQPLLWGLGLLAVPVIIHLINLMRHRRVPWAAMEFLLASQRKHSTWIRLKELLLLLLRIGAVAAIVLIVARPRLDGGLGKRIGDVTTHHIVLLDDTFSMSDRFAQRNVFDAAKEAVEQIALRALDESSAQTFTLLRASRAGQTGNAQPDLFAETVNSELILRDKPDRKLNGLLESFEPSDLAAGPDACLKGLSSLLKPNEAEERIVYLISDFRQKDWREAAELQSRLSALEKKSSQLYFINAADAERPNLAVSSLRPASGTLAAGIEFFMHAAVTNYGRGTIDKVSVSIRIDGDSGGVVFVDRIEPGKSEVVKFPVFFSTPGEHSISVSLESDAVEADNHRYAVLDIPAELPVLVVDGTLKMTDGDWVAWALSPSGVVRSGLAPKLQPPSFLNDAEKNPLNGFRTAFICNVDRLEEAAVRNLEAFVELGGGVCFLVGERTAPAFFNDRLYRDGAGPFPVPLDAERPLFRATDKAPDIVPSKHPVFDYIAKQQNSQLFSLTIDRYFGVRPEWTPEMGAKAQTEVIARLRNGAPLAIEKQFGKGRVIAILTLPSRPWSDWRYDNPTFPVTMLELQTYLAPHDDAGGDDRRVGTPLVLEGDPKIYKPEAQILPPKTAASGAVSLQAVVEPKGLRWEYADTVAAGFYRVEQAKLDDTVAVRKVPLNVEPTEGELARFEEDELRDRLGDVKFIYRAAGRFLPADNETGSSFLSTWLMYALAAILLGEQALAYAVSYHAPPKEARA